MSKIVNFFHKVLFPAAKLPRQFSNDTPIKDQFGVIETAVVLYLKKNSADQIVGKYCIRRIKDATERELHAHAELFTRAVDLFYDSANKTGVMNAAQEFSMSIEKACVESGLVSKEKLTELVNTSVTHAQMERTRPEARMVQKEPKCFELHNGTLIELT